MKKCLFFIFFFCSIGLYSQSSSHLHFKGTEINDSLRTFVRAMQKDGFKVLVREANNVAMNGTFTNRDVILLINATPISKTTYQVGVIYLLNQKWSVLKNTYNLLKENLISKYGEPYEQTESFTEPFSETNEPMKAFKKQKAVYRSSFAEENGTILLLISLFEGEISVILSYTDNINEELNAKELRGNFDDL